VIYQTCVKILCNRSAYIYIEGVATKTRSDGGWGLADVKIFFLVPIPGRLYLLRAS
jgi:hypothetical protein